PGPPRTNPPIAANAAATTPEDTAATVAVLANDSDPDGDALAVTGITQPAHGAAAVNPNGTITYTPAADYHGPDSFAYAISDGRGGAASATRTPPETGGGWGRGRTRRWRGTTARRPTRTYR